MLSPEEKKKILIYWNNTNEEYPKYKCIHELFEERVKICPNSIAVSFENQTMTDSELNSKSNQLAHYLKKQGVKPDTLVAICLDRSLEMIVGIMG